MSLARISFELANVGLEDILLRELGAPNGPGNIAGMSLELDQSISHLDQMAIEIAAIRNEMTALDFTDLHLLLGVNPADIATELGDAGLANPNALQVVAIRLAHGGFRSMLDLFDEFIISQQKRIQALSKLVNGLKHEEEQGNVTGILEQNLPGNLKQDFAAAYSAWNNFQEVFLASSMISTELWYRHSKVGSLLDQSQSHSAAA